MANEVLDGIATDLGKINQEIKTAKEYLSVLKDAGEDTSKMEADIRTLEIRKAKWERTLEARGYKIANQDES